MEMTNVNTHFSAGHSSNGHFSNDIELGLPPAGDRDTFYEIMQIQRLKIRYERWKKEEEVLTQRIERKEQNLGSTKNEIYQLLGLYFVFQGVIVTAVAQTTKIDCKFCWIPMLLSSIASGTALFGVWYKLKDKETLEDAIRHEKKNIRATFIALSRLEDEGKDFDFKTGVAEHSDHLFNHKAKLTLNDSFLGPPLLVILLIFSVLVAISCPLLLCWGSNGIAKKL